MRSALTRFSNAIECRHVEGDLTSGFAYVELTEGEGYAQAAIPHSYVFFVLQGVCRLSCDLFQCKELQGGEFCLFSKGHPLEIEALETVRLVVMAFDVPLMKADVRIMKYCCSRAARKVYTFKALAMCRPMAVAVREIAERLQENKIRDTRFYALKNTEFFMYLHAYYRKEEVADVLYPLVNIHYSFKDFVLNNYLEAGRNVETLIHLSGIGRTAFFTKFKEEFGMTAKQWFMMQEAGVLASKAAQPGMTLQRLMLVMDIATPLQLNRMCRRYFDQTPKALIASLASDEESR